MKNEAVMMRPIVSVKTANVGYIVTGTGLVIGFAAWSPEDQTYIHYIRSINRNKRKIRFSDLRRNTRKFPLSSLTILFAGEMIFASI